MSLLLKCRPPRHFPPSGDWLFKPGSARNCPKVIEKNLIPRFSLSIRPSVFRDLPLRVSTSVAVSSHMQSSCRRSVLSSAATVARVVASRLRRLSTIVAAVVGIALLHLEVVLRIYVQEKEKEKKL